MKYRSWIVVLLAVAILSACDSGENEPLPEEPAAAADESEAGATERQDADASDAAMGPNVVTIRAVGKTFEGPDELPSGWTTFRFENASNMLHFGIIDVPPPDVSIEDFDVLTDLFQQAMDAMNAGDEETTNALFASFPAWTSQLGRMGGPGFLSAGLVGETTVYLEPGEYIMECYIKSAGIFHTTRPAPGEYGMLLPFTVTRQPNGATEPEANVTVSISNNGYAITGGELRRGDNQIRVEFAEQQALPSFTGNDIHVVRVTDADSLAKTGAWMDWRSPEGLEDPPPAVFLGGVNDMPAGSTAYFNVNLEAGDYAFIAEVPDPLSMGLVLPFSIP